MRSLLTPNPAPLRLARTRLLCSVVLVQHFDDSGRVSVLLAVLRLLWSKTGYDEVARAECQPAIDGVFKCLASEDHTVSYPAALVVRVCRCCCAAGCCFLLVFVCSPSCAGWAP